MVRTGCLEIRTHLEGLRKAARVGLVGAAVGLLAPGTAFAQPVGAARNGGILEIIGHADAIVKGVMLILVIASIATWSLWLAKLAELRAAKAALTNDITHLAAARSLTQTERCVYPVTGEMLRAADSELSRAGPSPSRRAIEGVEERVGVQLPMIEARAIHKMLRGTNIIASIGATAPFIGLAGTVWGIMNSFLGISRAQSTSLAVVAPGIAEALMATALGLAAAIPAVLIYNALARSIGGYRRMLSEVSVLTACVLSRETEQHDLCSAGVTPVSRWRTARGERAAGPQSVETGHR